MHTLGLALYNDVINGDLNNFVQIVINKVFWFVQHLVSGTYRHKCAW